MAPAIVTSAVVATTHLGMTLKALLVKFFKYPLTLCVLIFAACTWYRYAWTFEDTFITFRVIDNFVNGFGLRWNTVERVQVFTHPLWLLLLTPVYALTHEVILSTAAVSAACTLITLVLLYTSGIYRSSLTTSALILILFSTTTFPTYSSSGFENPLNHLLACLFSLFVLQGSLGRSPFTTSIVAALGMVTRLDTALFYLPSLLSTCISQRQSIPRILLGLVPLLLWEVFSLLYYGVLIPNTALAKVPHGVDTLTILRQGWTYFSDLVSKDLLASAIIGLAFLQILSTISRITLSNFREILQEPLVVLNAGTILYCAYVVWIGGDYLSYRFWSLPLVTAAITGFYWIERMDRSQPYVLSRFSLVSCLGIACAVQFFINITSSTTVTSIGDDRLNSFFAPLSLPAYISHKMNLDHAWRTSGLELRKRAEALDAAGKTFVSEQSLIGIVGYYAGPHAHLVETYALTEPLLARLPTHGTWRIGHFPREIPPGYLQWLTEGDASKLDPILETYLQILTKITREPIFSLSRLRLLIPFALGLNDRPLKNFVSVNVPNSRYIIPLSGLSRETTPGAPWNDSNHVIIPPGGILEVVVDRKVEAEMFEIAVDCNDTYTIDFLTEDNSHFRCRPAQGACPGMVIVKLPVPPGVRGRTVRRVSISPSDGDGSYSIGHLIFNP